MIHQTTLTIETPHRGMIDVTPQIRRRVAESEMHTGLCHLFLQHTSASLILCENADPVVQSDLEAFMQRLTPDGDPLYEHTAEGPDDMPAHVRSVLTHNDLTIPVGHGQLLLGTWQGVYLWEHRSHRHTRRIVVTLYGEATPPRR